ncbi:hypothetical protein BC834DRAFT_898578 [Gloeopeniophorella convolvens]|nr:hypothetical protein BC834DRAFT_898578 [Gloeopeniophorella convolvens]
MQYQSSNTHNSAYVYSSGSTSTSRNANPPSIEQPVVIRRPEEHTEQRFAERSFKTDPEFIRLVASTLGMVPVNAPYWGSQSPAIAHTSGNMFVEPPSVYANSTWESAATYLGSTFNFNGASSSEATFASTSVAPTVQSTSNATINATSRLPYAPMPKGYGVPELCQYGALSIGADTTPSPPNEFPPYPYNVGFSTPAGPALDAPYAVEAPEAHRQLSFPVQAFAQEQFVNDFEQRAPVLAYTAPPSYLPFDGGNAGWAPPQQPEIGYNAPQIPVSNQGVVDERLLG